MFLVERWSKKLGKQGGMRLECVERGEHCLFKGGNKKRIEYFIRYMKKISEIQKHQKLNIRVMNKAEDLLGFMLNFSSRKRENVRMLI